MKSARALSEGNFDVLIAPQMAALGVEAMSLKK